MKSRSLHNSKKTYYNATAIIKLLCIVLSIQNVNAECGDIMQKAECMK